MAIIDAALFADNKKINCLSPLFYNKFGLEMIFCYWCLQGRNNHMRGVDQVISHD